MRDSQWEPKITRWVAKPGFDLVVLGLIVTSIFLLALEVGIPHSNPRYPWLIYLSDAITVVFIVELILRYIAAGHHRRRFLRDYWIDIIAVLPLFRALRFLRILRMLRLFRAVNLLARQTHLLEWLFRTQVTEYIIVSLLLIFSILFGTLGLSHFHAAAGSGWDLLIDSFWETIFSLIAGEPIGTNDVPSTFGGKIVILLVQLCGLTFFALLTGIVSAVMIEKMRGGSLFQQIHLNELEGHVLICGFNQGVETLISELQHHPKFKDREIVVISEKDELPNMKIPFPSRLHVIKDDFTRISTLERCSITACSVAIIVSELTHNRTRQDADARTVLAALTIEKLAPQVHTCAELSNSQSRTHLQMGGVNEVIVTRDIAGHLLAQAAMFTGNVPLLQKLLKPTSDAPLSPISVEDDMVGCSFSDALTRFHQKTGAILVAVETPEGEVLVNPQHYQLKAGDKLIGVGIP